MFLGKSLKNHGFVEYKIVLLKKINIHPVRKFTLWPRFLLSYWYFDGIEDLYSWCKIETKSTLMGTEWLIMNF